MTTWGLTYIKYTDMGKTADAGTLSPEIMSDCGIFVPVSTFYSNLPQIIMLLGPHKMKMSYYFLVFDTLWNLGLF